MTTTAPSTNAVLRDDLVAMSKLPTQAVLDRGVDRSTHGIAGQPECRAVKLPTATAGSVAQEKHFFVGQKANRPDNLADADLIVQLATAVAANQRDTVFDLAAMLVAEHLETPVAVHASGDDLLEIDEVAEDLTCGTRTIWRLVARKELAAPLHVGGGARWERRDVQQYLELRKAKRGKRRR